MRALSARSGGAAGLAIGLMLARCLWPAAASEPASSVHETVTPIASQPVANLPGKRLVTVMVADPPGASLLPHRHAWSAFIYV